MSGGNANKPKMNLSERAILKTKMREKFANHFSDVHVSPQDIKDQNDSTDTKTDHKPHDQDTPETDASSEW